MHPIRRLGHRVADAMVLGAFRMTLHPWLQKQVDRLALAPKMEDVGHVYVRANELAFYARIQPREVAAVEERVIPGPRRPIRLRIYRADTAPHQPMIVFFHGSGFVICSLDTHDGLCRALCLAGRATVISVDYALAPEQPFPAAPDECEAATRWVFDNAAELGGQPDRIALCGDSAGGALAVVTARRLRDTGGPQPVALLLFYPVAAYPDAMFASWIERGEGYGLDASTMRWFWGHYLTDPEKQATSPDAAPLRTASFAGFPPAYVTTAEFDILRDEGEALAARLEAEGGGAVLVRYPDMNHGFQAWVGLLDRADEAMAAAGSWLKARMADAG
ncbi:alpha/beta hydrolase [Sphingomonas sp. 1P06PA]|uniref:alpha/beta hydrolase n=1 Tax=Sphingomonas sp. 1P06PA TaxID=554121 RepID=UPI0039A61812